MNRKEFLRKSLLAAGGSILLGESIGNSLMATSPAEAFRMKFSPDFGIFKSAGSGLEDQIKWGYDMGFRAWENTWMARKTKEEQELVSATLSRLGMEFGQFVGTVTFKDVTFAGRIKENRDKVLEDVKNSVEIAKRMNTRFIHNVLGCHDPRLPWDFQMANAIELLKRVAEIYEKHGLVMVMETMNHKINHPEMFLHTIPQAYALCKAVGSPSVKILCDIYHVQIQEGNVIPNIEYAWDEIAYFQLGDTPGRREPGTGEINYKNILRLIWDKGYRGFLGMEHGVKGEGREGDLAAVNAYREISRVD